MPHLELPGRGLCCVLGEEVVSELHQKGRLEMVTFRGVSDRGEQWWTPGGRPGGSMLQEL